MNTELSRWADPEQARVWTPQNKYMFERRWWVEVMRTQQQLGVKIPAEAIDDYDDASYQLVDLESIRQRELVTRHDVKARLEEFNAVAGGWQHAHKGMTGRDLDDNVELIQAKRGMELLAKQLDDGEVRGELIHQSQQVPLRGVWGPVGTGADMVDLLGSVEALADMNRHLAIEFGFRPDQVMDSVGQVYPRSIDYSIATVVTSNLQRLGVNRGWLVLVNGYTRMLSELAGGQWLEGDVSCSVVRRVAIANLFLAASAAIREQQES